MTTKVEAPRDVVASRAVERLLSLGYHVDEAASSSGCKVWRVWAGHMSARVFETSDPHILASWAESVPGAEELASRLSCPRRRASASVEASKATSDE